MEWCSSKSPAQAGISCGLRASLPSAVLARGQGIEVKRLGTGWHEEEEEELINSKYVGNIKPIQKECNGLKRPCWMLLWLCWLVFGITYEAEFLSEAKSSM